MTRLNWCYDVIFLRPVGSELIVLSLLVVDVWIE